MPPISGHSILVIGGSSGIGAAVAKAAAAEGAQVAIASSNQSRVDAAIKNIQNLIPSAKITGYTCDVKQDDVEAHLHKLLSDVTTATARPLDHIVYTAGIYDARPLATATAEYLRSSGQFGFVVPLLIAKLAPGFLNKSYTSSLIFTSGRIGEKPMKGATILAGWASALSGIVRGLALDLAPIRVNLVSPGTTDTNMYGPMREHVMAAVAKTALLGKAGTAEEVAEAYIYLLKDSNNTGSCVSTSGGSLIQ